MAFDPDLALIVPRIARTSMRVISALTVAGMMSSCAMPALAPSSLLDRFEWHLLPVPFFPDDSDQCGPVALASILAYWGKPSEPADLRKEIYLPAIRGTLPTDLVMAARKRGFDTTSYQGSLSNLITEIDAGHPLIALLDSGFWIFSQGHFVIITGYDPLREGVYIHSGTSADVFMRYERFLAGWDKTNRWTLRAVMPEKGISR